MLYGFLGVAIIKNSLAQTIEIHFRFDVTVSPPSDLSSKYELYSFSHSAQDRNENDRLMAMVHDSIDRSSPAPN